MWSNFVLSRNQLIVQGLLVHNLGVWKAPSFVEAIPYVPIAGLLFSMPKSRISCNKKRGAHLTNDTVPLTDLDQSFDVPVVKVSSGLELYQV